MNEKCESCGVPQDYHPPGGLECVENQLAQAEEREKVANECIRLLEAERNTEKARAEKVEQGLCGASNDLILLRERTEKVEFDCESLRLELQAEKHNHQKDNEHLLARAEKAEEDNKETRLRMDIRDRGNVAALEEIARQAEKAEAERDAWRNIIAMLCGDGGQYHQQHGAAATAEYCKTRFYDLVKRAEESQEAGRLREACEAVCSRYCNWYVSGRALDAADEYYGSVSVLRGALAAKPRAPSAVEGEDKHDA